MSAEEPVTEYTEQFVSVPVSLATDAGLSPRARAVAVVLLHVADREGQFWGGMKPLIDAGLGSERVIRKAMAELEANRLLERTRTRGGRMIYRITAAHTPAP